MRLLVPLHFLIQFHSDPAGRESGICAEDLIPLSLTGGCAEPAGIWAQGSVLPEPGHLQAKHRPCQCCLTPQFFNKKAQ